MNTKNVHILEDASLYQLHATNLWSDSFPMYDFRATEWLLQYSHSQVLWDLLDIRWKVENFKSYTQWHQIVTKVRVTDT